MTVTEYIHALRDPMGLPFYPLIFQFLLVFTFALHIVMVNLVVGGMTLALWGQIKGGAFWQRLSASLARATTVNLSLAIVLGVAPLLFVQVIYDPFWYTANTMSARWVWVFLIAVIVAFYSAYAFYLTGTNKEKNPLWLILGLLSLILAATTIHGLSLEQLHPESWRQWLVKGLKVRSDGGGLYAFSLPRLLHFIVPSWALTGIFLMLYARYFEGRPDYGRDYLTWVADLGAKLALIFSALEAGIGITWLFAGPQELSLVSNSWFIASLVSALGLLGVLVAAQGNPLAYSYWASGLGLATVFLMSYSREALRMTYLTQVSYNPYQYKLNIDWASTALFAFTFVVGLVIMAYPILVAYHAGKRSEPDKPANLIGLEALGSLASGLPVFWLLVVVLLGIYVSLKNGTLF
ncbi:hypothetical protein [Thermosulfuriphilus sp.]